MVANRQASYFSYVGLQRDMGQAWPLLKFIIHYHLEIFTRDHSYITSALVGGRGGVRKCQFLLILSTKNTLT